jgi:YHS domain-containing protein
MKWIFVSIILFSVISINTIFSESEVNTSYFTNVAVKSADVVSYFIQGAHEKGISKFESEYMEATWRFSSLMNKKLFEKEPEIYIPQYGGYCAYAMARGDKVSIDPKSWTIYKGKLYLNYSLDVGETWKKDKDNYIMKADTMWLSTSNNRI